MTLIGNHNTKIANDNINLEHIKGQHGLGHVNNNGELFIELCSGYE